MIKGFVTVTVSLGCALYLSNKTGRNFVQLPDDDLRPIISQMAEGSSRGGRKEDDDNKDEKSSVFDQLKDSFLKQLKITSDEPEEKILEEVNVDGIVKYIQSDKCKNIITMVGAGISTSAGIPDFRSPDSGLYSKLGKYNLPSPECMFDISFFRENPEPFFKLAKELFPGKFKPTPCHYFLKLLNEKGLLLRLYTQNIDTLERVAGIPADKVVESHGTFYTSHCIRAKCNKEYSLEWMKEKIFADEVPTCECGGVVKPDVIFFGERLPERFFKSVESDFPDCDLLIIIGTSLQVQPFASLVDNVPAKTPRLLINKEKTGSANPLAQLFGLSAGMDFDSPKNRRDVSLLGLCDDGCMQLAESLGWGDELKTLIKQEHERIDQEAGEKPKSS